VGVSGETKSVSPGAVCANPSTADRGGGPQVDGVHLRPLARQDNVAADRRLRLHRSAQRRRLMPFELASRHWIAHDVQDGGNPKSMSADDVVRAIDAGENVVITRPHGMSVVAQAVECDLRHRRLVQEGVSAVD
jgi:hypothetical protein